MSSADFLLHFGTDGHEISADTLLITLFATTKVIQEISKEIAPEKKIDIKIKALKEGSFCVDCSVAEQVGDMVKSLFSSDYVSYTANVIAIFLGVIELKKFLGGKKPKQTKEVENGVQITNESGETVVYTVPVVQIALDNQAVNDALSKQFEKLNEDEGVASFKISVADLQGDHSTHKEIVAERRDFAYLQKKSVIKKNEARIIAKNGQRLKILKLVFAENNKWAFIWEGNKISASILDADFIQKVHEGERFASGDVIIADLKIYQTYDVTADDYLNQDYQITKVHQHLERGRQDSMF